MKKILFVTITLLFIVSGCSMIALSELVTPARLNSKAIDYVVQAEVADMNDYIGYPNLAKVKELESAVDSAHKNIQLDLQQMMEKDNLTYSICKDVVTNDLLKAQEQEEFLFGKEGLLSLGLSLAGVGGLTGFLGLMRKRPGDVTPEEFNQAMQDAGIDSEIKVDQITEIIKGVEEFKKTVKDKTDGQPMDAVTVLDLMKAALDKYQSTDTKKEVASIRASA